MKKYTRLLAVALLMLIILVEVSLLTREPRLAEPVYPAEGVITADPYCFMRRDPDTGREPLRNLRRDITVQVLGEVEGEPVGDNSIWYEIMYGNIQGYVSSEFVRLTYDVAPGEMNLPMQLPVPGREEFQAGLVEAGFPADYVQALMNLHDQHPQWIFTPMHVNYAFATAVRGEFRPGVNMITADSPPEYKSMADQEFDYVTNTWYEYEPGWVGASQELIAYQMDPRNFLNETQIFQFENQSYNPDLSYDAGLANLISGSFMDQNPVRYLDKTGMEVTLDGSYVDILKQAGVQSGVSPYHLVSRIFQEVRRDGSNSVSGSYLDMQGYYNFYNIGAFGGSDPLYQGLVTARDGIAGYSEMKNQTYLFPWDNPVSAITGGAIFLGEDYINVDQNSVYLQKFNLASRYTRPFTHQYMGNVLAPEYEAIDIFQAYQNMGTLDQPKEFLIPVFLEMPEVVPSPTGGGNPNNWLEKIWVNGQPLPDFRPERYEYKLTINSASRGLAVEALPWNRNATVAGTGVYQLNPGVNEVILQITSPGGTSRNYRLSVLQAEAMAYQDPDQLPKVSGFDYRIDSLGYLYGADPATGANLKENLISQFKLPDGFRLELVDRDRASVRAAAGTGSILQLRRQDQVVNEFPVVIFGDLDGDGQITESDYALLSERVVHGRGLGSDATAMELAMDIDQDGLIDMKDVKALRLHLDGVQLIRQVLQ